MDDGADPGGPPCCCKGVCVSACVGGADNKWSPCGVAGGEPSDVSSTRSALQLQWVCGRWPPSPAAFLLVEPEVNVKRLSADVGGHKGDRAGARRARRAFKYLQDIYISGSGLIRLSRSASTEGSRTTSLEPDRQHYKLTTGGGGSDVCGNFTLRPLEMFLQRLQRV